MIWLSVICNLVIRRRGEFHFIAGTKVRPARPVQSDHVAAVAFRKKISRHFLLAGIIFLTPFFHSHGHYQIPRKADRLTCYYKYQTTGTKLKEY
jgi:hypothetical protein